MAAQTFGSRMNGSFCAPSSATRFAERLLADTDCQAFGLVERGYAALSQPGGTMSTALTGMLVIAVAFFGYRLLLGRGLALSDTVALAVKIGVVLLIATSWSAWQAFAYEGLARAPTQVASEMLTGIGAPPPLESLQKALDDLAAAGVGYRSRAGIASPWVGGPAAAAMVLNVSSVLLTLATVGILVAARVVLAILLAIAPAMAGFLLFDTTRGMTQGWIGAMAAAAIAPLFVLLVAAVEFAILSPMIARLLAEQAAERFENTSVMPIGLVTIVFGIALIMAVRSGTKIAYGIKLARLGRSLKVETPASVTASRAETSPQLLLPTPAAQPAVARALESLARRDPPATRIAAAALGRSSASLNANASRDRMTSTATTATEAVPTRPAAARLRSAPRRSRAAARRDS
jgi:type IV secretion system protein VirB6